jgi:hypothetical protein
MHYGQLLADFNKVAQVPARLRLIVLAADNGYVRYIEQSGRSVLPLKSGGNGTDHAVVARPARRHATAESRIPRPMARSPHHAPPDQHGRRLFPVRLGK